MYIMLLLLSIICLYIYCIFPRFSKRKELEKYKRYDYAHRGLHNKNYPENTLAAFENAKNHGYGIELDVQLTKDNIPVIAHDFHLLRSCGIDKQIDECTYEELQQYHVFNSEYTIPKFEDVLNCINHEVPLIIEIKQKGSNCQVCVEAQKLLDRYKSNYVVESFNPIAMNWYLKNRPNLIRGQLSYDYSKDEKMNKLLGWALSHSLLNFLSRPDFTAYDIQYLNEFTFNLLNKLICSVVWTVKDVETYNHLKEKHEIIIFEQFKPEK